MDKMKNGASGSQTSKKDFNLFKVTELRNQVHASSDSQFKPEEWIKSKELIENRKRMKSFKIQTLA